MTRSDDERWTSRAAEQAIAAISRRACPPLAETLVALVAAWQPADRAALDGELDELALPLFTADPTAGARAGALAALMADAFDPEEDDPNGLWLDAVLATRRAHPVLLATVAVELGRRAGWDISLCSTPTAWYAGLRDGDLVWLIDPTGATAGAPPPTLVRRHCAHELAFVVLTGLAERLRDPGDAALARALRDRLSLFEPPGRPGRALLGALWTAHGPRV